MAASILPFPQRRSLELPPAQHGETAFAFVQRMCLEASLCIEESPSAAAIFLEAAAHRLQREAIERSSTPTNQEVRMTTTTRSTTPSPELVTLIEKASTERDDYPRKHHYSSAAAEIEHELRDLDRLSRACERVVMFPSRSLADLALKAATLAEFGDDIEKDKAFDHLVADIGRVVGRSG